MFKKIYSSRMKPILETDSIFNPSGEKPVRSSSLIQIRDSFGYIVGNTEGEATSIDADFLLHDELDLSDETMITLFQSRMQNSELKTPQSFKPEEHTTTPQSLTPISHPVLC